MLEATALSTEQQSLPIERSSSRLQAVPGDAALTYLTRLGGGYCVSRKLTSKKQFKKRSGISACPAFFLISCKTLFRFFAFAGFGKCDNFFLPRTVNAVVRMVLGTDRWLSDFSESKHRNPKNQFFSVRVGQFTSKDRFEILGRNLLAALSTNLGLILTKEEMGP